MRTSFYFLTASALFIQLLAFSVNATPGIIHVAKTGDDANSGSVTAPLLTIKKAAALAHPGDKVIIHKGTYREMIPLQLGGTNETTRISYSAAPGEEVTIKGSEQVKSWVRAGDHGWRAEIDSTVFKGFNPFAEWVNNDSSYAHLGEVYLDNRALKEKKDADAISNTEYSWFAWQENGKTIIIANFGRSDPNKQLTEITTRPSAFIAERPGIGYITLNGFTIAQVASGAASVNGLQPGAISTNGGSHWLIQNCILHDCKSVAISIGQTGHDYPTASPTKPAYSDLSQDTARVGHHIIRHNHIFHCGQAGIFGLLHGSFSLIEDNLIEDINDDGEFPSEECAGIRLALAIDAQVDHNLIRRINGKTGGYGLLMGPLLQGTRISRNIISETRRSCLYFYNSHGPVLIDNNILAGPGKTGGEAVKMLDAEANVFVQNLFYDGGFTNDRVQGRPTATSNFLPHSLVIKQTIPALAMDDRWFSNLFIKSGLDGLTDNPDCLSDYNVYLDGAIASSWGDKHSKTIAGTAGFTLIHSSKGVGLMLNNRVIPKLLSPVLSPSVTGFFALSKQFLEYPDGRGITIDHDFNGSVAGKTGKLPGPFYQYFPAANKVQSLFTY
ncbi:MAG TPA: right-handed parallel beta-helix repeat-containing protein [Chitinophagaceae bacterium]|jgi:parallel beta-helix repeat protein